MRRAIVHAAAGLGCCGSLLFAFARCDELPEGPPPRDPSWASDPSPRAAVDPAALGASTIGAKTSRSSRGVPLEEPLHGASDPGVRPGAPGAGAPDTPQPIDPDDAANIVAASAACLPALRNTPTPGEPGVTSGGVTVAGALEACAQAVVRLQEVQSVSGTLESGVGLGPTYNANSCAACHSQPAVLGSGVSLGSPQRPNEPNPLIALATLDGAKNQVPFFLAVGGPVREARFTTDGAVHDLFTIAGRTDAVGCNAVAPDFRTAGARGILRFRIPTPMFGDGLVENVPDSALRANLAQSQSPFDTGGAFQISRNDGTISRFGWKAQGKSLLSFVAEAYGVEQGVTSEEFPIERAGGATNLLGCLSLNATPEDTTDLEGGGGRTAMDVSADTVNFALAVRLSRPPTPSATPFTIGNVTITESDTAAGDELFASVGCASCHTPSLTTAPSSFDPALSGVTFHPYSDFAIHHMGAPLADGITQGSAGGDQFRTAPLWGLGQRQFFLHDGRTNDLTAAIAAHGGDATTVIDNYNKLSASDQQVILYFLRSL
jgi:CxxC motif-containing protein (DUF1111 family)